ncbi:MAG: hypothetical protein GTN78_05305 [Gemmatimonadales bacterium]|nr:hypothetical protein [Gemmatimonadales bacterium]NIN12713.1 hypothetical protein [Gemmatimonadales bacterium]NIQ99604.1 hypothetical protein [Gemmatimonadales bacterium]NIS64161.1 hypothetical protein [Gemmatimonadales bacterium]
MKRTARGVVYAILVVHSLVFVTSLRGQAQDSASAPPPRSVIAVPLTGEIRLDGRLDEPAWRTAQAATDLYQWEPHEGQLATQSTEVRFLFDADAIYIGARMYDELGAAGIQSRLVRRDQSEDSDELQIVFDAFHDHLGRTMFSINPSGVKGDAYGPGGHPDDSWDPVWDVETRIDSLGWTAEMRIPLSQLRFSRDSVQTWGLQIIRNVNRLNEVSCWSFWRLNESGGPTRFGHLDSLRISRSPSRAEFLPYVVGRSVNSSAPPSDDPFHDAHELDYRMGLDLKYLLTSNLTLSATVNPDFGQVEVDPAVVNLTAFETFFPERRPFFVEGQGFLSYGSLWCFFCSNTSSIGVYYSRRVGRAPQGAGNAYAAGPYSSIPENTTILGAAKITGRTASGWSIGLLDAVTAREHAAVMSPEDEQIGVEVEPLTNYFVGRVRRDLKAGNLVIGGALTSVARDLRDPALAQQLNRHAEGAGLDLEYWWKDRTYRLASEFAVSQISGTADALLRAQRSSARYFQRPDRQHGSNGLFTDAYDSTLTSMRGFAGYTRLSKESGNWLWEAQLNLRSPGFETNDLAFLRLADWIWMSANLLRHFTTPTSWYRRMVVIVGGQQQYNFDGDLTDRQVQAFFSIQPLNYWNIQTFYIHRPDLFDDRRTRGGPVVKRPAIHFWHLGISTDTRKKLALATYPEIGCNTEGACDYGFNLDVTWRPASNISLSVGPAFNHGGHTAQYVTAVDDSIATAFHGRRYVFSDLDQNSISMNTRLNVTFTPNLTLEVFLQPLISSNRFTNFKEYDQPRELAKSVYGRDVGTIATDGATYTVDPDGPAGPAESFTFDDPDFNFRSLRGNAVLRWEFRPGSTLYLVWTQSRADAATVGDFDFGRDVRALFDAPAENIFLLKINYWLGL